MSETGYLVWLIAMAIATVAVLAIGTMAAAGILPRRAVKRREDEETARSTGGAS